MSPQRLVQNVLRGLIVIQMRGIDAKIGHICVDFPPGTEESVEAFAGIFGLKERALAAAGGALEEDFRVGIEPPDDADLAQGDLIWLAEHQPATRGEDDPENAHRLLQDALLHRSKVRFSGIGKDFRDGAVFSLRHQIVCVDEAVPGQSSQATAHGRFAAAHEANQYDVGKHRARLS